jgi:hypothetical protein
VFSKTLVEMGIHPECDFLSSLLAQCPSRSATYLKFVCTAISEVGHNGYSKNFSSGILIQLSRRPTSCALLAALLP